MGHPFSTFLLAAFVLAVPAAMAGPGAHGPNGEHLDAPVGSSASGLVRLPDGSVNVPKLAQRRLTIRTRVGVSGEHPLTLELNGRVVIDPNAGGLVQAPFAGQLAPGPNGFPVIGQRVRRGQVLAQLRPMASAVERGNQEAQLAEIRANLKLAQQRVTRLEALVDTVPRKELDAARAELASLTGREHAVAASVRGSQPLVASADGVIARTNVMAGKAVDARDVLFEIVDPQRMAIDAYSPDAAAAAQIEKAALRGIKGVTLHFLGAGRSLQEGAVPVSFRAQAGDALLSVGQPVTVIAQLRQKLTGIALPAEAVVRNQVNEPVVWIKTSAERFLAQPVEVRPLDSQTVVVVKGLSADNRVVVAGASLINQIR